MKLLEYRVKTFYKYKDLIIELVKRDVKLKYRRSFLGYIWSVLDPLLTMIVLSIVFSTLLGKGIENYPVYLLTGRLLFEFMKKSTTAGMKSVTGNASMLRKVYVPKYIFTLSKVTSSLVDLIFSIGALLLVMLVTGAPFKWRQLMAVVFILQVYIFSCGLGLFLAQLNVFFRDIEHIYGAVLTAWFYVTPIIYQMNRLDERVQFVIKAFNPMYYFIAGFRDLMYYGNYPGPRIFWGGWLIALLTLAFGVWSFQRTKDKFMLYI